MNKIIYLSILLLYAFCAQAQIVTIKDKQTHQPLEHVSIYSNDLKLYKSTDAHGCVDISVFKGIDSVRIELIGYQSYVLSYRQMKEKQFLLFMEKKAIVMNQVVVSASRWQQETKDIPYKVVDIGPLKMRIQNSQTTADLLAHSNQVFIQKSQLGGGSPMIRGFATNRVLISVDGVRMNTAIFRSGNLQNVISLDPFSLEKTEVVFGPGSTIYGSDAIGGVMSFYSLSPRFSAGKDLYVTGSGVLRSSSANFEKTAHVDINIGLKKWAFLTSLTFTDYDHLYMGEKGPDDYLRENYVKPMNGQDTVVNNPDPRKQIPTGYNQLNLMQKIRFKPNQFWDFTYGLHVSQTSNIPRYDRLIEFKNDHLKNAQWYYGPQKWYMNNVDVNYMKENRFFTDCHFILAYQYFEESRHDRKLNNSELRHRVETVDVVTVNLDFNKTIAENHKLFYGTEMVFNKVGSEAEIEHIETGEVNPTSTRYPDGSTWNSYAAYLNYQFNATDKITLHSGIRYNQITMKSEFDTSFYPFPFTSAEMNTGALSGSVGMIYRPETDLEFKLNLSTGFRAPNVDDMGKVFDSEPGSVIVPNPDLSSEYAYNIDLGIVKINRDLIKYDFTVYYTILDNAMVRRNYILSDQDSIMYDGILSRVQAIQNTANACVWGIETGIELKLPWELSVVSRLNYQQGQEENEDGSRVPVRHIAPWFGSTHLLYSHNRFNLDLSCVYSGTFSYNDLASSEKNKPYLYALNEDGNPYAPGWYTLNIKIRCRLSEVLTLSAGVENITDQRYRPYSSGIAGPGRNFMGKLRVDF
ncbi:MAG: TonB-dependent receptor [bacterium]